MAFLYVFSYLRLLYGTVFVCTICFQMKYRPRTSFTSSQLVRLLADLANENAAESKKSFAERLGQWLDLNDAIALSGVVNARVGSSAEAQFRAPAAATESLQEEVRSVRTALVDSITTDGVFKAGKVRIKLPTPAPGAPIETAASYLPYRRYYLAHQREMDASIGLVRTKVQKALATHSPALHQLAALDAVMDKAMGERQRDLLLTIPLLLEKRFDQLRQTHQQALAARQQADDPELWLQAGGWLAVFCRDMQSVLRAELEVRLQPVMGLIEALSKKVTQSQ